MPQNPADHWTRSTTTPRSMSSNNGNPPISTKLHGSTKKPQNDIGVDLVFRDVTVNLGSAAILYDVSGTVKRGEIMAVMGPSGAGKSTLLNALTGRLPLKSGQITLNKQPLNKQMRRRICYVLQQDIFFSNLTLRQTLTFTAMLRLPDKMKRREKMRWVEEIVDTLDLRKCLDTVMGGIFMPGLSGGEKKRANIACELLTNPMLMLLDEPTSGLDSAIAYNMLTTLKAYTQTANKTVVTTIHQPSSAMFHMFDRLLLLNDGHVAYFGPGSKVLEFFSSVGLVCTPQYNPADFILEKLKEDKTQAARVVNAAYKRRCTLDWPQELRTDKWSQYDTSYTKETLGDHMTDVTDVIVCDGRTDVGYITKNSDAVQIDMAPQNAPDDDLYRMYDPNRKWPTGFWTQFTTLTHRNVVQSRDRIISKTNMVQTVALGIIVCVLWLRLPRTENTLNDRMGLLFYITVYWGFFSMFDAISTFPTERPVIKKERSSGAYRVSAYFCAKMASEFPLMVLQPVLFYVVVHWVCNLSGDVAAFFSMLGVLLLNVLTAQSFGLFVGTIIPDVSRGITIGSVFMLGSMLAGGFYTRNIGPYFVWLKYCSYLHYAYHAFVVLELQTGAPLECLPMNMTSLAECSGISDSNSTRYVGGDAILAARGVNTYLWLYLVVLVGVIIFFRFLAYISLRFYDPMSNNAPKQRPAKNAAFNTDAEDVSKIDADSNSNHVNNMSPYIDSNHANNTSPYINGNHVSKSSYHTENDKMSTPHTETSQISQVSKL